MARSDFRFSHRLRVRWAEADMQGVVFNGNYLLYFDVGITEYLRALAADDASMRDTFDRMYVVKATVEYHAPARFDEEIDVCVRCARLGRSSMVIRFEIHRGSDHLISGENVYVYTDAGASAPLPPSLREAFVAFETVKPEA